MHWTDAAEPVHLEWDTGAIDDAREGDVVAAQRQLLVAITGDIEVRRLGSEVIQRALWIGTRRIGLLQPRRAVRVRARGPAEPRRARVGIGDLRLALRAAREAQAAHEVPLQPVDHLRTIHDDRL